MPKFSDIPQFLSGHYGVDVPLGHLKSWLESQDGELDLHPDFQRGHVWTPKQQSAYMEFLVRGGKSSRILYWNHPAYTGRSTDHCMIPETLVLVDGKQRLTACLLFLDDKVPVFGCTFSQ